MRIQQLLDKLGRAGGILLHFVHLRAWDIAASPLGAELRRLGVAHRFLIAPVNLRYRRRIALLLKIYPTLLWRVLGLAWESLGPGRAAPDAVVVSSDIEALVFGGMRRLLRRRTRVVFQTLIVTRRGSAAADFLYMAYWRLIVRAIDLAICHARSEVLTYRALFPGDAAKFVFVPYGTTVGDRAGLLAEPPAAGPPAVVTAGRSGRDFPLLARAVEGLDCRLQIVCDIAGPVAGIAPSGRVEILRDRFDRAYLRTLAGATVVAVPLAVDDISAGQMVLLQAAALGRAVVITRTATTVDYADDEVDALLVPLGDQAALHGAIARLLGDGALRCRLGAAAAARFDREHSTEAFVRGLVLAVGARK